MTIKQSISKGLGALTPEAWKSIVGAIDAYNEAKAIDAAIGKGDGRRRFKMEVTGAVQDGSNMKWYYQWRQVRRTAGATIGYTAVAGGMTHNTNGGKLAINSAEANNGSGLAYGYAVDGSGNVTAVAGFSYQRVPNGAIFTMTIERDTEGATSFEFDGYNRIDGACPATFTDTTIDAGTV